MKPVNVCFSFYRCTKRKMKEKYYIYSAQMNRLWVNKTEEEKIMLIIIKLAPDKLNISVTGYYYQLEITWGTIMYSATDWPFCACICQNAICQNRLLLRSSQKNWHFRKLVFWGSLFCSVSEMKLRFGAWFIVELFESRIDPLKSYIFCSISLMLTDSLHSQKHVLLDGIYEWALWGFRIHFMKRCKINDEYHYDLDA